MAEEVLCDIVIPINSFDVYHIPRFYLSLSACEKMDCIVDVDTLELIKYQIEYFQGSWLPSREFIESI